MFQISLRQLLLLVATVALAIVTLNRASYLWQSTMTYVAVLVFLAGAIVIIVGRGASQAFAVGLVIALLGYGCSRYLETQTTIGVDSPATQFFAYLQSTIARYGYFDGATGKQVIDLSTSFPPKVPDGTHTVVTAPNGATVGVYRVKVPRREYFVPTAHCWLALLLGYAAGKFAQFVYHRRTKENAALRSE